VARRLARAVRSAPTPHRLGTRLLSFESIHGTLADRQVRAGIERSRRGSMSLPGCRPGFDDG
jgi:hypothetical protein